MTMRKAIEARTVLTAACVVVMAIYVLLIDLKGISTDEGIRLGIINGGAAFTASCPW